MLKQLLILQTFPGWRKLRKPPLGSARVQSANIGETYDPPSSPSPVECYEGLPVGM